MSSKAVFLITDGYSNGGDPRPAAELLKTQLGVHIFTFGIRNGNVKVMNWIDVLPIKLILLYTKIMIYVFFLVFFFTYTLFES